MSLQLPSHDQPSQVPEASAPTKKRRRPALACRQCRRRKIRCDQNKPCNNCTKSRIADCTYPRTHVPGSSGEQPGSPRRQVLPLAPRVAVAEHSPRPDGIATARVDGGHRGYENAHAGVARSSSFMTSPSVSASHTSPQSRADGPSADVLLAKIGELEKTVSRLSGTNDKGFQGSLATASRPSSPVGNDGPRLRFGNQSNWLNNTNLYSKVLRVLGQARGKDSPLSGHFARCQVLGEHIERQLSVTAAVPTTIGTRIPDKEAADELLDNYFRFFEGWLRVLHGPSFRAEYEKLWQQRDSANDVFLLQLQVCLALGVTPHAEPLRWRASASQWLLEAETWLSSSVNKPAKKPPGLEELQLACLVLMARANASGSDHMHQCWVSAGHLVRRAMWAGLHRDPGVNNKGSTLKVELRRRLWATIMELNLLLSLQAGRTPLISVQDYDTLPPENIRDEQLSDEQGSGGQLSTSNELGASTDTSVQTAFFESFKLRLEIVCKVNGLAQDMPYDEMLRLHSELSKARKHMEQSLPAIAVEGSNLEFSSSQAALADIFMCRYFLALHLPVLGLAIKNPAFHFSRRFCLATAIRIMEASCVSAHAQRNDEADSAVWRSGLEMLFVNSPGIFRHIAIQAIFALALELITAREEERENYGAIFPVCDVDLLMKHLSSARDWAAKQIQAGLVDMRSYCFLGACLSYAEALASEEETSSMEEVVVSAAVRGTMACWELLNAVSASISALHGVSDRPGSIPAEGDFLGTIDVPVGWADSFMGADMNGLGLDWAYPMNETWNQPFPGPFI